MDCRETQTLLTAFHDGELPDADRIRLENHLRGCPECGRLLADLARADEAAGVPDPGPGYWDRFNARLAELRTLAAEVQEPSASDVEALRFRLRRLEAELKRRLEARVSQSAGAQTGKGGGIDPWVVHQLNRAIDKGTGVAELKAEISKIRSLLDG